MKLIGLIALFLLVMAGCIYFLQERLIYFPRRYGSDYLRLLESQRIAALEFPTDQGLQHAFYVRPESEPNAPPDSLWVFFGGNGSLALDWWDIVRDAPAPRAGFLLVDYPGYGFSEGKPNPETIRFTAKQAFTELAGLLGVERVSLEGSLSVVGHSLGAAVALQFATDHPVNHVILVAPFTSMRDMARLSVGGPLSTLLRHNYDNRARLRDLVEREEPPQVHIFHGTADRIVPVRMGRELAETFSEIVRFTELPGEDHVSAIYAAEPEIHDIIAGRIGESAPSPRER